MHDGPATLKGPRISETTYLTRRACHSHVGNNVDYAGGDSCQMREKKLKRGWCGDVDSQSIIPENLFLKASHVPKTGVQAGGAQTNVLCKIRIRERLELSISILDS